MSIDVSIDVLALKAENIYIGVGNERFRNRKISVSGINFMDLFVFDMRI